MGPQLSSSSVPDFACSGAQPRGDLARPSPTGGRAAQRQASSPREAVSPISPTGPGHIPVAPLPSSLLLRRCSSPPLLGGSSTGGGSACSLSPPDSGTTRGGAAALSSLAAGCPYPLRGWGPTSRSPPPLGSSPPWAATGGTPGATAPVPDFALATLPVPGCFALLPPGAMAPPADRKSPRRRRALGPGRRRAPGSSLPRPRSPSGGFD